jgi:hypothetical protein
MEMKSWPDQLPTEPMPKLLFAKHALKDDIYYMGEWYVRLFYTVVGLVQWARPHRVTDCW